MANLKELVDRLNEIEKQWVALASVPEDLSSIVPGLSKTEITTTFGMIRLTIEEAIDTNQDITPIYFQQMTTQLGNIEVYIKQHIPGNPSGHIPPFVNMIYSLMTAVNSAFFRLEKSSEEGSEGFTSKLKSKLTDSLAKSQLANKLLANTNELIQKNQSASAEIARIVQTSQDATTKIQERDRTTSEATNRISETEKKSVALVNQLETHLKTVEKSSNEVTKQQTDLTALSKTLTAKLKEAQDLLEDANRLGLAGAFKTRKSQLTLAGGWWIFIFLISFGGLLGLAINSLSTIEGADWHQLLFRLPFSAPLVWLGWFSVKQYGYTRRLQEDYSFKVASAMSFQGYKNEVNTDPELLRMLRQSAIENFSANPIRIYDDQNNHGSPLHELLDDLGEDKMKKVTELIKALNPMGK